MKELIEKYREQHKDVPQDWKLAVITKMKQDPAVFIDVYQDIDWLYDDAVYYLFENSQTKIKNLAKKLGYKEIPCETCRNIIKYWKVDEEWMWNADMKDKFEKYGYK